MAPGSADRVGARPSDLSVEAESVVALAAAGVTIVRNLAAWLVASIRARINSLRRLRRERFARSRSNGGVARWFRAFRKGGGRARSRAFPRANSPGWRDRRRPPEREVRPRRRDVNQARIDSIANARIRPVMARPTQTAVRLNTAIWEKSISPEPTSRPFSRVISGGWTTRVMKSRGRYHFRYRARPADSHTSGE